MAARKKNAKKRDLRQTAFTRFMLIVAVFVIWIGGISVRLVHLQVKQHNELSEKAARQRQDTKSSKLLRGTIYDRNGRVLAMSVNVKTLYADATEIVDLPRTAKTVAKLLGVNEKKLLQQLTDAKNAERRFVPLAKGLDGPAVEKINQQLDDPTIKKALSPRFTALYWREDQKRSYPNQTLAAHVVGFSNADGIGQAGIEQSQNDILYGAIIKKTQERDRLGRVYDETVFEKEPPKDVVLTLDNGIQYVAEQALEKAAVSSGAKAGMAIVIDNETGAILALANYPTFDPNILKGITADNLKNSAIQNIYSPGSVFKLITYGSALERKLITPESLIDSGSGTIEVAGHRFTDGHPVGKVSYSKAMAASSNVCAIKTSLKVGKEGFYDTVTKMGFGRRTGIELPAETGGIVRRPERWNGDSLASMSIGYEIGVSALQMATAFATIANDGVRIQPHIIKEILQPNGEVVSVAQPEKTQVVSAETASDLRKMLREVVLTGTGKRAQLNGYSSAGKTGTAWKFDEKLKRVNAAKYVSSFIGFAPADDPKITIAVVMDEPKVGGRNGGQVSAPVFQEIADQILPILEVPRDMGLVAQHDVSDDIPETAANGDAPDSPGDSVMSEIEPAETKPVPPPVAAAPTKREIMKSKPAESKQPAAETKRKAPAAVKSPAETKPKGQARNKLGTGVARLRT